MPENDIKYEIGISVIICCYNSVKRLGAVLEALCCQQVNAALCWELIVVDNASDDGTREFASQKWASFKTKPVVPFSVLYEPIPGLANARKKGLAAARYKYALFCDDDNWLEPGYTQGMFNILNGSDEIAACGGTGIPFFETKKPFWFDHYAEAFAVGSQAICEEEGTQFNLYGAGMALDINALYQLEQSGFKPQMVGRTGKKLASAEDTELTYALVLAGYKLHYAPDLTFYHYMPKERLDFDYVKKLFAAFGQDGPVRNLYYAHLSKRFFHRLIKNWYLHLALSFIRMVKYLIIPPKKFGVPVYFKWSKMYIKQLFAIRKKYKELSENISSINKMQSAKALNNTVIASYTTA